MEGSGSELEAKEEASIPLIGSLLPSARGDGPSTRAILRIITTVVVSAFALYLIYRLRTPISWVFFAAFIAVALSAPVNVLTERMPRGAAIALVYAGMILIPIGIGAVLVPSAVEATSNLVNDFPEYVNDIDGVIQGSDRLSSLDQDFAVTQKLQELAQNATGRVGDAAGALASLGASLVGSLFAILTIFILSGFILARGRDWVETFLRTRPEEEADVTRRALDRMAVAVAGYVAGAIVQATIAGVTALVVLSILGVPSPLALAVVIAVLDLIPLIGATIGAILVGIVTLFVGFPTVTIIWVVFSIAYQQFENYVLQPRIQARAVALDPFVIVVAAIFGGTLLGIVGALLAIPIAAAGQIGINEFLAYRREGFKPGIGVDGEERKPGEPALGDVDEEGDGEGEGGGQSDSGVDADAAEPSPA